MLIEDIFEDEGEPWTEGRISWLPINTGYYHYKMVQVVYGAFRSCIGVSLGAAYRCTGSQSVSSICFFRFFLANKTQNPKDRTACRPIFYFRLTIPFANFPRALHNFTS